MGKQIKYKASLLSPCGDEKKREKIIWGLTLMSDNHDDSVFELNLIGMVCRLIIFTGTVSRAKVCVFRSNYKRFNRLITWKDTSALHKRNIVKISFEYVNKQNIKNAAGW